MCKILIFIFLFVSSNIYSQGYIHKKKKMNIKRHKVDESIYQVEVSGTGAKNIAKSKLHDLINQKKLPAHWKGTKAKEAKKKRVGKKSQWVVAFDNPKKVKGKEKLYIYMSDTGHYKEFNFVGK